MDIITEIHKTLSQEFERFLSEPRFEKKLNQLLVKLSCPAPAQKTPPGPSVKAAELDRTIRQISIIRENDHTLIVTGKSECSVVLDCRELGFRDSRTKGWRFLMEVLSGPDHTFNFGPAYIYPDGQRENRIKCKFYDARWKLCDDVCRKLMDVLAKHFGLVFPYNYKLYEKVPTGPEGERRFKFQIKPAPQDQAVTPEMERLTEQTRKEFDPLNETQMASKIHRIYDDYLMYPDDTSEVPEKLAIAFKIGKERFGWSDGEMQTILNS